MNPPRTRRPRSSSTDSSGTRAAGVVTLEMVAEAAGVSPSTVSRILNGTAVVSSIKRQAVEKAIARLKFRPNPMARGLAMGQTLTIGVVTQAIDSPFYGMSLRGIEDGLKAAGYMPLFVSGHWNPTEEKSCIEALLARRVDGIIVLTGKLSDRMLLSFAKAIPIVVTGRALKGPRLCSLDFDNKEGARLATRHLIELGHTQIAFISGDMRHPDALERERGCRIALEEAGMAWNKNLVVAGDYHEASGLRAVNQLLKARRTFTALFAANDQMAFGAILGLYRKRLRVPEDVSIIGFDDLPCSLYAIPPLTTVRLPVYEMGHLAALAILDLLRGLTPTPKLPPPQLVPRESTQRL